MSGLQSLLTRMTSANAELESHTHVLTCIFCKRPKTADVASDSTDAFEATRTETQPDGSSRTEKFWVCSACCTDSVVHQVSSDTADSAADLAVCIRTPTLKDHDPFMTTEEKKQECACQACLERREMEQEQERELCSLRKCWLQLRHSIRQMYRDGLDANLCTISKKKQLDEQRLKHLVHQLAERDAHQLYQKLESQGREYVMDMKVNLLEILVSPEKCGLDTADTPEQRASATGITLEQTKFFLKSTLDSFSAFQETVRNMQPFIGELDRVHLEKFGITWKVVNHHLFDSIVYQDSLIQSALPAMAEKLGLDLVLPESSDVAQQQPALGSSPSSGRLDETGGGDGDNEPKQLPLAALELAQSFRALHRLMRTSREIWEKANKRMEEYAEKQVKLYKETLRAKQRMLKEDLEFFKQQRRLLEKYVAKRSSTGDVQTSSDEDLAAFTETLRQLLTGAGRPNRSHAASPVRCQRCRQRHCPCDECTISHVITCGLLSEGEAPPTHVTQQELNEFEFPPSLLEELPALDICDFKLDMLTCGLSPDDYVLDDDDGLTSSTDDSQDSTDSLTETSEDDDDYDHIDQLAVKARACAGKTSSAGKSSTTKTSTTGGSSSHKHQLQQQRKNSKESSRFALPRKLYTLHDEHSRKQQPVALVSSAAAVGGSGRSTEATALSDVELTKVANMKRHMQHAYGDWQVSTDATSRLFSALPFDLHKAALHEYKASAATGVDGAGDGCKTTAAESARSNGPPTTTASGAASLTVTCDVINGASGNAKPNSSSSGKAASAVAPALPPPRNAKQTVKENAPTAAAAARQFSTTSTSSTSSRSSSGKASGKPATGGSSLGGGSLLDAAAYNLGDIYCERSTKKMPLDKAEFIKLLKQQTAVAAAAAAHKRGDASGNVKTTGNSTTTTSTAVGGSKSLIKANADGVTIEVTQTKHYTLDEFCNVNYKDVAASPEVMRRVYENLREAAANMDKAVESGMFPAGETVVKDKINLSATITDAFPHVQVGAESKPAAALHKPAAADTNNVAIQVATSELAPPTAKTGAGKLLAGAVAPGTEGDDASLGGHHCDCCYCEMFGDGSGFERGFPCRRDDVRERLRQKLKRKGEESQPPGGGGGDQTAKGGGQHGGVTAPADATAPVAAAAATATSNSIRAEQVPGYQGNKSLECLLEYIEGRDSSQQRTHNNNSQQATADGKDSKAAKRQRQRQKKLHQQQAALKERLSNTNNNNNNKRSNENSNSNNNNDNSNTKATPVNNKPPSNNNKTNVINNNNSSTQPAHKKEKVESKPTVLATSELTNANNNSTSGDGNGRNSTKQHQKQHLDSSKKPSSTEPPAESLIDVFRPKTDALDQMDEADRDVEMFKQFVLDCEPRAHRAKVNLDLSNLRRQCGGGRLQQRQSTPSGTTC